MFFSKPITSVVLIAIVSLHVASCKVSVNAGTIEDAWAPDVREDAISEEYASILFPYADSVIADLYEKNLFALKEKSHSEYAHMFDETNAKTVMKLLNAEKVDQSKKEYLGYNMYKTKDGLIFASLFYRVPLENGSDQITLNIDADMNDCCKLVGYNVEKQYIKSFLGKDKD